METFVEDVNYLIIWTVIFNHEVLTINHQRNWMTISFLLCFPPNLHSLVALLPGIPRLIPLQPLYLDQDELLTKKKRFHLALSNSSKLSSNMGSLRYWSRNAFLFLSLSYWVTVVWKSCAIEVWLANINPETWYSLHVISQVTNLIRTFHIRAFPRECHLKKIQFNYWILIELLEWKLVPKE